jgi:CHAT domain-containing protein
MRTEIFITKIFFHHKRIYHCILKKIFILFSLISFCQFSLISYQINDVKSQYTEYFNEAENFRKNGEFEKSITLLEELLSTAKKINDEEKECEILSRLGLLYWNIGNLNQSSNYYKQALHIAEKISLKSKQQECKTAIKIFNLYSDGKKFRSSGQYQQSIKSFQDAIYSAKESGSREHEVKCLRQLSATYWNLNNLSEFLNLNVEALKIAQELNHKKEEERCLLNIGVYYDKNDNYSNALNYYHRALRISQSFLSNEFTDPDLLNNIGVIYINIGNYEKALDYLKETIKIDRQLKDYISISKDLINIGSAYRKKGLESGNKDDFYEALDYYSECLQLIEKIQDEKTEIQVLNNIGAVYSDLENHPEAFKYFQLGYKKAEKIEDKESMGMILNNIGIVHFNLGNFEESTKYYQKAIDLALDIKGGQILWEAYLELANAYVKQNKLQEALKSYKDSISIIEDIRSEIKLEELKASYLGTDKRIAAYHNLIDLLVTLHKDNPDERYDIEAFNYLERAKARSFLDRLELSKVDISRSVDPKLINEERELMKDISSLYTKLLAAGLSLQEKEHIQEELNNYENRLEALKREIRTQSPAYADIKYPEIITLEETQKDFLDKKTAFLAYSVEKNNSYLFTITKKSLKIFPIPKREDLKDQVSNYLKLITDKDNRNFHLGYTLFQSLIRPGLEDGIENLIFVPDDILNYLPFEALITDEQTNNWLIKDYKIAYVPSISSFREIIQNKRAHRNKARLDILAFGDPQFGSLESEKNGGDIPQNFYSSTAFDFSRLKYSSYEIQKIKSLFKRTKSRIFQQETATEEQLKKQNLEDYKIIHFATHSLIDDKKPARSSIILSLDKDPQEDGFLQMREVYDLKLNSDLIVLSACQTGLGQFIRGEGIEGLNRAFFFAGASSVLMSLWSVNDQASAQLMERFYHHLRSSESISNALRKTKLEMIHSDTLSHPFYWAGFIVSGMAEKVIFPNPIYKWLLWVTSVLLGLGMIIVVVKRFAC